MVKILGQAKSIILQNKRKLFPSVPTAPHMDSESIMFLTNALREFSTFLEYGSGGSTLLAIESKINHVISVESDKKWIRKVKRKVRRIDSSTKIYFLHANIGKVRDWGTPVKAVDGKVNYAELPWSFLKNENLPMLVLIDGRFRVTSFLVSIITAPKNSVIIFDDYYDRCDYWVVERVIIPSKAVGRSAVFKLDGSVNQIVAQELLIEHRFNSD